MYLLIEIGIKSVLMTGYLQGKLAVLSPPFGPSLAHRGKVSSPNDFRNIWLLTWQVNQASWRKLSLCSRVLQSIFVTKRATIDTQKKVGRTFWSTIQRYESGALKYSSAVISLSGLNTKAIWNLDAGLCAKTGPSLTGKNKSRGEDPKCSSEGKGGVSRGRPAPEMGKSHRVVFPMSTPSRDGRKPSW